MSYTFDITDSAVFTVLRSFIMDSLGSAVNDVVRAPVNRASMPKLNPFIIMSPLMKLQIHRPIAVVSDPATPPQSTATQNAIEYRIQLDAYGPTAGDIMMVLTTLFNAPDAFDYFAANSAQSIRPLYALDLQQNPIVDGEMEYISRWTMTVCLQYNPTLTLSPVQTASTVTAGIISVEAAYN